MCIYIPQYISTSWWAWIMSHVCICLNIEHWCWPVGMFFFRTHHSLAACSSLYRTEASGPWMSVGVILFHLMLVISCWLHLVGVGFYISRRQFHNRLPDHLTYCLSCPLPQWSWTSWYRSCSVNVFISQWSTGS